MRQRRGSFWLLVCCASLFIAPLLPLFLAWQAGSSELLNYFWETELLTLSINSFLLSIGSSIGALLLGSSLAWLVSMFQFPGKQWLSWVLVLPMAIPPYIFALIFLGIFDFSGPIQQHLRTVWPTFEYIEVRNYWTLCLVMSLSLYPYIYLILRNAFHSQMNQWQLSRCLGISTKQFLFRVALPMAGPMITSGVMLIMMETLSDLGTVSIFNYKTFSLAIYTAWIDFYTPEVALQLSGLSCIFAITVLLSSKLLCKRFEYVPQVNAMQSTVLKGAKAWAAVCYLLFIACLACFLPVLQLIIWSVDTLLSVSMPWIELSLRSMTLVVSAATLIVSLSFLLLVLCKQYADRYSGFVMRIAYLGYLLPGFVIAIALMISLEYFDRFIMMINETYALALPMSIGSLFGLFIAYALRFIAVSHATLEPSVQALSTQFREVSQSLGTSLFRSITRIQIPLLRPALQIAFLMLMLDLLREIPITLILRPIGWDTLAVKIFEFTSEAEWQKAALPALMLVIFSIGPVILLARQRDASKQIHTH